MLFFSLRLLHCFFKEWKASAKVSRMVEPEVQSYVLIWYKTQTLIALNNFLRACETAILTVIKHDHSTATGYKESLFRTIMTQRNQSTQNA